MKLFVAAFLLVNLAYTSISKHNQYFLWNEDVDTSLFTMDSKWEIEEIQLGNIPDNTEFEAIRADIVNMPECSKDDYLIIDTECETAIYQRNSKCVPEEGDMEAFNLNIGGDNVMTISDGGVEISMQIVSAHENSLVLEFPLNYGETEYYYTIVYKRI